MFRKTNTTKKNIGIVTIIDNNNYGNRLQNYALQQALLKLGVKVETIKNDPLLNNKVNGKKEFINNILYIKKKVKNCIKFFIHNRFRLFCEFNKNIKFSSKTYKAGKKYKKYDCLVVGSDQVWNPNFKRLSDFDLADIKDNNIKISYAASFGVNDIPTEFHNKLINNLNKFKNISVREEAGKNIIKNITNIETAEVLIDPTMLLTVKEWEMVIKKPVNMIEGKYILNYFLGNVSEKIMKEIEKIALENDCEIINILDKNSPFYKTGPAEFLYLEKNAFLVCTDSFHSSVFSIIFNRPFIIFNREDSKADMNSRLETLIKKLQLKNREYNGVSITKENLNHNYENAYEILEIEREKSIDFLRKSII